MEISIPMVDGGYEAIKQLPLSTAINREQCSCTVLYAAAGPGMDRPSSQRQGRTPECVAHDGLPILVEGWICYRE
jgi:hypothetical protein